MTHHIRLVVGIACLALAAGACKKKDDEKKPEPAPKTTTPDTPAPQAEKTTADFVKQVNSSWELFNKGDMENFAKGFAENVTLEIVDSGQPVAEGRDAAIEHMNMFRTAFPDLKGERALMLANGDKVLTVDLMTGTHKGELMGVAPTEKQVGLLVAHQFTFNKEGLVQSELVYFDAGSLMGQLGVHEMPHRAAMTATGKNAEAIVAAADDKEKANLELVKQVDELFNAGKIDEALGHMSDDCVMADQTMPEDITGKEKIKAMFEMYKKAMPDAKFEQELAWAAGDYVVRAGSWSGTNTGPMPEMGLEKATNKPIKMRMLEVIQIADGKGVKSWSFANGMAMAMQLGMIEAPAAPDKK